MVGSRYAYGTSQTMVLTQTLEETQGMLMLSMADRLTSDSGLASSI